MDHAAAVAEFFLPALCPDLVFLGGKRMSQAHVSLWGCLFFFWLVSQWIPLAVCFEFTLCCQKNSPLILGNNQFTWMSFSLSLSLHPPPPRLGVLVNARSGWSPSFRIMRKLNIWPLCCPSYPGVLLSTFLLPIRVLVWLSLTAGLTVYRVSKVVLCINGAWRNRFMPSCPE